MKPSSTAERATVEGSTDMQASPNDGGGAMREPPAFHTPDARNDPRDLESFNSMNTGANAGAAAAAIYGTPGFEQRGTGAVDIKPPGQQQQQQVGPGVVYNPQP